jgi:hypothetical protein
MTSTSILRASIIGALVLGALCTAGAIADVTTVKAAVHEEYVNSSVNVAGGLLVGLAIGPSAGNADPRAIRVPLAHSGASNDVCVSTRTIDGRYWSTAAFVVPSGATGLAAMDPNPGWQYLKQLATVPRNEFAAVGLDNKTCSIDESTVYLPISYDGPQDQLSAKINSPRIIEVSSAVLKLANRSEIPGTCATLPRNVRLQEFNVSCTFSLAKASSKGLAQFVLQRYERTGERSDTFAVLLP